MCERVSPLIKAICDIAQVRGENERLDGLPALTAPTWQRAIELQRRRRRRRPGREQAARRILGDATPPIDRSPTTPPRRTHSPPPLAHKLVNDNKKGSGWAQLIGLVLIVIVAIAECI